MAGDEITPQSRTETLLAAAITGQTPELGQPQSRVEALLMELCEAISTGGGGGSGGVPEVIAGENVQVEVDESTGAVTVSATDTTYEVATTQAAGLMSTTHFSKVEATPTFWVGTQAAYDELAAYDEGTIYWIVEAS